MTTTATDFGRCMSCSGTDLHPGRSVSGEDAVVEHVDRLLRTAPGQLIDDPDWGIDLEGELSNDMGMAGVVKLTERVRQALVHDPRIPEASVKGRWDPTPPGTLRLDMTLYLGTGPFELTGTVSELGLTVERLRQ